MTFVDYEKVFDSVETHSVLEALQEQGINGNYVKLIRDIYTNNPQQFVCIKIASK